MLTLFPDFSAFQKIMKKKEDITEKAQELLYICYSSSAILKLADPEEKGF